MSFVNMFNELDKVQPVEETIDQSSYEPTYVPQSSAIPSSDWANEFGGFRTRPVLYNMDGYISPYASNNWGATSTILKTLGDESRLPPLSDKVDPNKIFTSDISALRTLAADQIKITKMFEKKLIEGLTDRGKIGLNEGDIMAMQALTSARSAITAINKEQIAIKKNIADLRIKQQQNSSNQSGGNDSGTGGRGVSTMDIGRSIMDNIFDAPSVSMSTNTPTPVEYHTMSQGDASRVLDDLIPTSNPHVQFESMKPKTVVLIGETDDDVEYVTYSENGEIISDYPNPTAKITKIDRDAKTAVNEMLEQYDLEFK